MAESRYVHEYPGAPEGGGEIISVAEGSPFDDAGFTPGCRILSVDGNPLRDVLDWRWYADGEEITVEYVDCDGEAGEIDLFRDEGEDWGVEFDGAVFDKIKTCRNACVFCFMHQLPKDVRASLVLRDDDWRLSFLQGNFVTLTNLKEDDFDEIVERHISPLRLSLHCITPEVRRKMIGKHAQHGIDMLERLLEAGIEFDAQIVLTPGYNDGLELQKTLTWAYMRPGILNIGIVPLGYTKHQQRFEDSYNDPEVARSVIETVEPMQKHALAERGFPWVYLADEFYCNAFPDSLLEHLPPTEYYGRFEMFEDGIGIVRTSVDEWESCAEQVQHLAEVLEEEDARVYYIFGEAQRPCMVRLMNESPAAGRLVPLVVKNNHFGGNVDVTGLLCGFDVAMAIRGVAASDYVVLPKIMFNSDGFTLDDMTVDDIRDTSGVPVTVVSCSVPEYLAEIEELVVGY